VLDFRGPQFGTNVRAGHDAVPDLDATIERTSRLEERRWVDDADVDP
jgi:hypothetical protein